MWLLESTFDSQGTLSFSYHLCIPTIPEPEAIHRGDQITRSEKEQYYVSVIGTPSDQVANDYLYSLWTTKIRERKAVNDQKMVTLKKNQHLGD